MTRPFRFVIYLLAFACTLWNISRHYLLHDYDWYFYLTLSEAWFFAFLLIYTGFRIKDMRMKTYQGIRPDEKNTAGVSQVLVNGEPLPLAPSQKLFNHSPDGYNWGYSGSGPAQLSLALLLDALGDQDRALRLHQQFKSRVVAAWHSHDGWMITQKEIRDICRELEEEALQFSSPS